MVWMLNLYISSWLPSLLSLAALLLCAAGLVFFWLSGRLLGTMLGERNATAESKRLRSQRALQQLRMVGPKLCLASLLLAAGWGIHDLQEYHSTYVLANAAVEQQQDVYLVYHFVDDPSRMKYTFKFCEDYVPDLQPHQIIEVMVYVRKHGCESIAPYKAGLKIRRYNGVPILEGE